THSVRELRSSVRPDRGTGRPARLPHTTQQSVPYPPHLPQRPQTFGCDECHRLLNFDRKIKMTQNVDNPAKAVPPCVTDEGLEKALNAFVPALGPEKVAFDAETLKASRDPYQIFTWTTNLAAAVDKPNSTEELQEIVRLANEHRIPLWPIGRGKNNGYGGPAPQVNGSIIV